MMKKIKISKGLLTILLAFVMISVYAQHDHSGHRHDEFASKKQKPPHSGVLAEAGKFKIEMVANLFLKKNKLSFYVYKRNLKPLASENIIGVVTVNYKDGSSFTDTLKVTGTHQFVTQLSKTESFNCTVSFSIKNKNISASFFHKGLDAVEKTESTYSCPMHPEVKSDAPESCPKCGMTLEEEK